jgi:hypothetical protein
MASRIQATGGDLAQVLQQRGGRIVKAINDQMQLEMKAVQKLAIAYAPVDEGNLENAIKLSNENRRRTWTVYVDESMPDDTGRYTVGDYAMWLHEGVYELGPKSQAKSGGGGKVGRKYLERAFQDILNTGAVDRLADMAKQYGVSDAP